MSKTKKSKLLASMLCATVVAGLYAGPVMADNSISNGQSNITVEDNGGITIDVTNHHVGDYSIRDNHALFNFYGTISANSLTGDELVVEGSSGAFKVKDIDDSDGNKHTMVFASSKTTGKDTLWLNTETGNLATNGSITVGGVDGTAVKTIIDGATGNIAVGVNGDGTQQIHLNAATGSITAADYNGVTLATNGTKVLVGGVDVKAMGNNVDGIQRNVSERPYPGNGKVVTNTTSIEDGALEVTRVEKYDSNGDFVNDAWSPKNTITANGKMIVNDYLEVQRGITAADGKFTVSGSNGEVTAPYLTATHGLKAAGDRFTVNGVNGDVTTVGSITANGAVITSNGNGTFKIQNIKGNTMAYMVDKDGNYTVGINAQNGNIETKGALAVTNAEGNNVFTANSNGMSVGGGLFAVDAATGNTNIAGGLNVGTNIEVAGSITASSLTLGEMNVGAAITELQEEVGSVGGDLTDLTGRVGTLETNTAGITNDKGVTVIDQGLKVKGEDGREVFSVARDGAINAVVTDGLGGTNANFVLNGENVELKYGNNGITANIDGTTISGNGTDVVVNENGATFTNANGTTTVINGGAITADTLKLANLDEDVATEINNLKDSMDTVGGDVSDLRNDVAQNTNDIGLLRTDVGVLRTDVNTLRVDVDSLNKRLEVVEDKTQNINGDNTYGPGEQPSGGGEVHEDGNTDFTGNINSDSVTTGEITADKGTIGGVTMEDGKLTADEATIGDVTVGGSLNVADKVTVDKDGVAVKGDGENNVKIDGNDVSVSWKDDEGNSHETSIRDNYEAINDLDNRVTSEVNRLDNRISKVEDRIDKVGAMSAAIANLRTMGYDPTAPTEIAVGIGQYRSETGAALGLFHYPNKDFMLSLSVSTSGDEVMGGIGATWKFGRKTPEQMLAAEKEKAAKAKLAKAEAMKKAAAEAKVAEQQAKHAKMAAEKAAK